MKIELEVPNLPEGYKAPVWGPLYTSVADSVLILIGERWRRAVDHVRPNNGGSSWIYAEKDVEVTERLRPDTGEGE